MGQSTFAIPASFIEDQYTVNVDSTLSPKDQIAERFFYSRDTTSTAFAPNAANVPGWGNNELDHNVHFRMMQDELVGALL